VSDSIDDVISLHTIYHVPRTMAAQIAAAILSPGAFTFYAFGFVVFAIFLFT
jgi:hypothetical protein